MITVPSEIQNIIDTLEKGGFEAYIVGGCVRDILLGKEPFDYDITTNALPEQIKSLFKKTADTGIAHGTVTVITENKTPVEVTTFRTESGYADMRHPERVSFVSDIKDDLSRRDFTVNAIAFNEKSGIVDFFGGILDIENKILRAVGNPKQRFFEDALRILRLFRFASVLNFKIEKNTKKAALSLSDNLKLISAERVSSELKKAISGKSTDALSPLINAGGLKSFGIEKCKDLKKISKLPDNENLRLFAFFKLCGCDFSEVQKSLKLSNAQKNYLNSANSILFLSKKSSKPEIKLALSLVNIQILYDVADYKSLILGEDLSNIKQAAKSIAESAEPYKISHLEIRGDDLKKAGIYEKDIGKALKSLANAVRKNPNLNTKEQLLNLIKK